MGQTIIRQAGVALALTYFPARGAGRVGCSDTVVYFGCDRALARTDREGRARSKGAAKKAAFGMTIPLAPCAIGSRPLSLDWTQPRAGEGGGGAGGGGGG